METLPCDLVGLMRRNTVCLFGGLYDFHIIGYKVSPPFILLDERSSAQLSTVTPGHIRVA